MELKTWLLTKHPLLFLLWPPPWHLFDQILQPPLFTCCTAFVAFSDRPLNYSRDSASALLHIIHGVCSCLFVYWNNTKHSFCVCVVCVCGWLYLHLVSVHLGQPGHSFTCKVKCFLLSSSQQPVYSKHGLWAQRCNLAKPLRVSSDFKSITKMWIILSPALVAFLSEHVWTLQLFQWLSMVEKCHWSE